MRILRNVFASFFMLSMCLAKGQSNELGVLLRPMLSEELEMGVWYKYPLNYSSTLRSSVFMDLGLEKEVRSDSFSLNQGRFAYELALGWQKEAILDKAKQWRVYAGVDAYWDAAFIKQASEDFYGYYYSLGLNPLVGFNYTAFKKLRCSLELRSDLNFNFQSYSDPDENYDRKVNLTNFDHLALGIGYLF